MKNKTIAVMMGGPSAERDVSLNTGKAILEALQAKGYRAVGIDFIPEKFAQQLADVGADVVFNALHGKFGEDGALQGALDMLGIPYTGSGVQASAVAMDKMMSKRLFAAAGIPTPRALYCSRRENRQETERLIRDTFSLPVVVKAATQGSSIGVHIVSEEGDLAGAIEDAFTYSDNVVIEEFIRGKELTVAIIGSDTYEALPVIEIVPHSGRYDYRSKYTKGCTDYLVPAPLDAVSTAAVQQAAVAAAALLGCRGVARADIMMDEAGNPYVLEINTVPGMTATSLVPKAAAATGLSFPDLCEKLLLMAIK